MDNCCYFNLLKYTNEVYSHDLHLYAYVYYRNTNANKKTTPKMNIDQPIIITRQLDYWQTILEHGTLSLFSLFVEY